MHISEIHMAIILALSSSLILSGLIVLRKAKGMAARSSLFYLRTASWMLAGFSTALAFI